MANTARRTAGVIVLLLAGLAMAPSALTLRDFEAPESLIENAELSFAYRYYDDPRTTGIDVSTGHFGMAYDRLFDTPDFGYTAWGGTTIELADLVARSWTGSAAASYRYYVSEELPLFVYAGGVLEAATYQIRPGCEIRSGVGVGRLRDVTPMAQALRITDALVSQGTLARRPSDAVLLRIANQIAAADAYEEPSEWMASVAEVIESLMGVGMDAESILILSSELGEDAESRYCGAIIQGGVGFELIDAYAEEQDILYVMSADVAHAPTADSQLRCRMSVSGASTALLADNTSTLSIFYTTDLRPSCALRAEYELKRVTSPGTATMTLQTAAVELAVGVGRTDLLFHLSLANEALDVGWTVDLSVSLAVDLL